MAGDWAVESYIGKVINVVHMPLTPAHIGPALLIGAIAGRKLNLTVLITSAILIDLEVLYLGIQRGNFIYHGFFHTLAGAASFGFLYGTIFFTLRDIFWKRKDRLIYGKEFYIKLRDWQNQTWTYSYKCIVISAIIGVYSHISLDWLLYENIGISIFLRTNIYYEFGSYLFSAAFLSVYLFCIVCFFLGLLLFGYRYSTGKNRWYKITSIYDFKVYDRSLWTGLGIISTPFAISGIVIFMTIIYSLSFNPDNISNHSNIWAAYSGVLILSIFAFFTMIIGYFISLRKLNWKLFE